MVYICRRCRPIPGETIKHITGGQGRIEEQDDAGWSKTTFSKFYKNMWKRKCRIMDNTKIRKKEELLPKKLRGLRIKGTNYTQKFNWRVSAITDVFLNKNRKNVCEHTEISRHVQDRKKGGMNRSFK